MRKSHDITTKSSVQRHSLYLERTQLFSSFDPEQSKWLALLSFGLDDFCCGDSGEGTAASLFYPLDDSRASPTPLQLRWWRHCQMSYDEQNHCQLRTTGLGHVTLKLMVKGKETMSTTRFMHHYAYKHTLPLATLPTWNTATKPILDQTNTEHLLSYWPVQLYDSH